MQSAGYDVGDSNADVQDAYVFRPLHLAPASWPQD
jgi:hypothetical protein